MAKATVLPVKEYNVVSIKSSNYVKATISNSLNKASISKKSEFEVISIKSSDINSITIYDSKPASEISEFLPFKVKFFTIGINPYGSTNPAPIGIAIVGYSNYVL